MTPTTQQNGEGPTIDDLTFGDAEAAEIILPALKVYDANGKLHLLEGVRDPAPLRPGAEANITSAVHDRLLRVYAEFAGILRGDRPQQGAAAKEESFPVDPAGFAAYMGAWLRAYLYPRDLVIDDLSPAARMKLYAYLQGRMNLGRERKARTEAGEADPFAATAALTDGEPELASLTPASSDARS